MEGKWNGQQVISLFEKIDKQDSNVITKSNLIKPEPIVVRESANIDRFPFAPFVKKALEVNYTKAANALRQTIILLILD